MRLSVRKAIWIFAGWVVCTLPLSAGRLDKDTTGFVLLTDDGELTHPLWNPPSLNLLL